METTIRKWGNSAGIIIPQSLLKDCDLSIGETVDITSKNRTITIKPVINANDITAITAEILNLTRNMSVEDKNQLITKIEKG